MAEGARFELAVPLRGLRFSRPARSAAPSPLRAFFSGSYEFPYFPRGGIRGGIPYESLDGLRLSRRSDVAVAFEHF